MRNISRFGPLALIFVIAGLLVYLGWQTFAEPAQAVCGMCGRAVHLASRVDGVADGDALTFCCAACALRAEKQGIRDLRVTRVFDYETGAALDPQEATTVVGSNVNLCMREHVLMDAHKETSELHFDRCAPSILAFKSEAAADKFRKEHGGVVKSFTALEESYR